MKINKKFLGFVFLLVGSVLWAQVKTVTGTVTDNKGNPQGDAAVIVQGTGTTVYTDVNGQFTVQAEKGQTIKVESLDEQTGSFVVGERSFYAVSVKPATGQKAGVTDIDEVVVTALGIKKQRKELTYATSEIKGSDVSAVPTADFISNLSGKVAGLDVKTSGNFGGSTNLILRGMKSINGNNQALFVVDGVPLSNINTNNSDQAQGRGGNFDFGSTAALIDPNDVESVNVLKGAAATALYGSMASNGAIMITTKKGKKGQGLGVEYNTSVSVGSVDNSTFVHYQKEYGQGYGAYYGQDGDTYFNILNGEYASPFTEDASYGAPFDPNLMVYQWDSFLDNPDGVLQPWTAAKNTPLSFFQHPIGFINSISIFGSDEKFTYKLGYTNNNETGLLPNSSLNKNNIQGSFSYNIADNFTATTFINYARQNVIGRNETGYTNNLISGFRQWWPINVDIERLKYAYEKTKSNYTWNWTDKVGGSPIYWNNPYFQRYENYESDTQNHLLTGISLSWDVVKGLNILGRATIEKTDIIEEQRLAVGTLAQNFALADYMRKESNDTSGYSWNSINDLRQTYDLIATWTKNISNYLNIKLLGGGVFMKENYDSYWASTWGGLLVPGIYSISNSANLIQPLESQLTYQKSGLYAEVTLSFWNQLYLNGTYRYDESTGFSTHHRGYSYPSVGASWVFSELFKNSSIVNFAKISASYAEVGADELPADAARGFMTNNGKFSGLPIYSTPGYAFNYYSLVPERTKSWEGGVEVQFFQNRIGFNLALYKTNTINQFMRVPVSAGNGVTYVFTNEGNVENKGIELALHFTPVKTRNFRWDLDANWAANTNKLVSLSNLASNLELGSYQGGISINATEGKSLGVIWGKDYVYDDNGNRIVNSDGFYEISSDKVPLADVMPKWTGGVVSRFTYKNLALSFQIDVKHGGHIFSLDQYYGQGSGIYQNTAGLNDLGNPLRDPVDQGGGLILPGVKAEVNPNGSISYVKNDIRIPADDATGAFDSGSNPSRSYIYNAGFIKLRNVQLIYTAPESWFTNNFIKGMSFSLIGSNLWIIKKYIPDADPEAGLGAGNLQGFQSGVLPTTRTYSFNVKIKF
ncbi:MAG: SusC/RagA family TonB-linked outer membrane protein [Flavobacteriaceae bacterium]|jgi:TonB-linked SusC/RagA family outer membrane protein|nr:SusC/RagA family TonB-linked outer membrane protein [Flavobacteriaceae bacterium]